MRDDVPAGIPGSHSRGVAAPPQASSKPVPLANADMTLALPLGLRGDASAGHRFYDANCATCHGIQGDGQGKRAYFINPKPRSFTSLESRALFNRPAIYAAVAAGKRGTEMPAWDKVLTPQQIADVSEYLFLSFIRPGAARDVAQRP